MWSVPPAEPPAHETEPGELTDAGRGGRGIRERESEFLVFVRGREEVVRLGVDAAVDAQEHRLRGTAPLHDRAEALDLDQAVDDDRPDADLDRALQLGEGLVVAVEAETGRVGTRRQRDRELAARADVDGQALLGHPAHHLGAEERLAGVVHARLHAVQGRRRAEGLQRATRGLADELLVEDVQRRAESVSQLGRRDAPEPEHAVVVALRRRRPHRRSERVRVVGHVQPGGSGGAGVRVGGHGGPIGGSFGAAVVRESGSGPDASAGGVTRRAVLEV